MVALARCCKRFDRYCFENPIAAAALLCAAVLYGALLLHTPLALRSSSFSSLIAPASITALSGTVTANPVKTAAHGGSYRVTLSVHAVYGDDGASSSARGSVLLFLPAAFVEAHYPAGLYSLAAAQAVLAEQGERLQVQVRAVRVRDTLTSARGEATAFVATAATSCGWGNTLSARLLRFRALSRLQFKRLMYAWGEAGGLVLALLSGSREYLSATVSAAFIAAGLPHILALSGMHLSLLAGLARGAGSFVSRRFSVLLHVSALATFVWFAGLSPSLMRALLCALITLAFALLRLPPPTLLQNLLLAFLLHVALLPQQLYTAAALLSYGALLGIALFAPLFSRYMFRLLPPCIGEALSDSAAAQLATAPISALLFARIAPIGIVAALVVSPLITLFLYLALFGIVLSLALPFLSPLIRAMIELCYTALQATVCLFAKVPGITF